MTDTVQDYMARRSIECKDEGDFTINQKLEVLRAKFANVSGLPGISVREGHSYAGAAPFTKLSASMLFDKADGGVFVVNLSNDDGTRKPVADGFVCVTSERKRALVARVDLDTHLETVAARVAQWATPTANVIS